MHILPAFALSDEIRAHAAFTAEKRRKRVEHLGEGTDFVAYPQLNV